MTKIVEKGKRILKKHLKSFVQEGVQTKGQNNVTHLFYFILNLIQLYFFGHFQDCVLINVVSKYKALL